jgi:hypothetical protein
MKTGNGMVFCAITRARGHASLVVAMKSLSLLLLQLILLLCLLKVTAANKKKLNEECPCKVLPKPSVSHKKETARWMAHSLDWGVLSTISTRVEGVDTRPTPFGNVYSFVDGPCNNSTGTPYFYGTYMDQSFLDTRENTAVSFTLSEASLSSVCHGQSLEPCRISTHGDPENPVCARLVLTGTFQILDETQAEYSMAKEALFQRHASMRDWPADHEWIVAKIDVQDVWLIDYFGGATVISVQDYMAVNLTPDEASAKVYEYGTETK